MEVILLRHPTDEDWIECKRRALVTMGKDVKNPPDLNWKRKMLKSRHSPIRYLQFSFYLKDIPSWVSVHLVRHIHAQPYVKSQRNDRQSGYDRNKAPQDTPVDMIWDMNAEEFLTICNKRLCYKASEKTRYVVWTMTRLVADTNPEFTPFMVPMCFHMNMACPEFDPCGMYNVRILNWKIERSFSEESVEQWKSDLAKTMDAGKSIKEKILLDGLREAIQYDKEEVVKECLDYIAEEANNE